MKYRIVHLDAGRKYFSPVSIKKMIKTAAEAGYNQFELYLSDNQGFRLALDDMVVRTASGKLYDLSAVPGDGYSDGEKFPDGSGKYLTQAEMNDVIAYAKERKIELVPCMNTPGHMGALLLLFPQFRCQDSRSSADLEKEEAVEFAFAFVRKYAEYFAEQGVGYFNLGADEYANDRDSMGFERLYASGKYGKFVEYLNAAAETVLDCGMIPRAFNDGLYYNNDTGMEINRKIQVCYWSAGWDGYRLASPAVIAGKGHELINARGDYYWVLGDAGWQCSEEKASGFDAGSFQGGGCFTPAGAMFCIWCDNGAADGPDDGAAVTGRTEGVIRAFGERLGQRPGEK